MSTAQLQQFIDERNETEQRWLANYLFNKINAAPVVEMSAKQLAELSRRMDDIDAGRNCVTLREAEAHWDALDRKGQ